MASWLRAIRFRPLTPALPDKPVRGWSQYWPTTNPRYAPLWAMAVALAQSAIYIVSSTALPHSVSVLLALAAGALLGQARPAIAAAQLIGASPRRAATGTLGLLLLTLLRLETLANLEPDWFAVSLVVAAGMSHALAVCALASVPRRSLHDLPAPRLPVSALDALVALVSAALPIALISTWTGDTLTPTLGAAAAVLAAACTRGLMRRRLLQGRDARVAALVQQTAEIAALIGMLAILGVDSESPSVEDEDP